MFMAAASLAGVVTMLDAVGAFGAQAVQHGARGLDAEAVRAFEVLRRDQVAADAAREQQCELFEVFHGDASFF